MWHARINVGGRSIFLGNFLKEEDAIKARHKAEWLYEGQVEDFKDWIGRRFKNLTVIEVHGLTIYCKCDCGNEMSCPPSQLTGGYRASCG